MTIAYLTKTYRFNAGHRLHNAARDDAWNLRTFGKCSYPGGHGHNYTLEVTVRGAPDRDTGRVAREEDLDAAVAAEVMEKLDHRNLNEVLPSEVGPAPTTEVLVAELWKMLGARIPGPATLHRLKVSETSKNSFEYFGPDGRAID
jgi:6-pyruvoyltetrahydropterin/6-carboxytetrahydropterin synthase